MLRLSYILALCLGIGKKDQDLYFRKIFSLSKLLFTRYRSKTVSQQPHQPQSDLFLTKLNTNTAQ